MPDLPAITDALRAAQKRDALPTTLGTEDLREMGADVLARSVFTARGSNAVFADALKKVIDRLTAGDIGDGQARTAIYEILDALGYDAEMGGFPGEELEPALKGTIQDLRSHRRVDLIVRTQRDLMRGAGQQMRGSTPDRLSTFPAWELVRVMDVAVPRDWPARWKICGGELVDGGRMIALKGDPIWGELGSYDTFDDALGVDHPPFCFNSGMGWRELSAGEVSRLGITGPDAETPEEYFASQPITLSGRQPLPTPQVSMKSVDPAIIARFKAATKATANPAKPGVYDYSDTLADELRKANAAYQQGGAQ